MKYVIVSPVRNEEQFVEKTIQSVVSQTVLPQEWILVNDGSTDKTVEIIEPYLKDYPWMKLLNLTDRGFYYPGTGIVNVFYKGFESIQHRDWQYVVKLDCDLFFEKNYFETVLKSFGDHPRLGIASGCTYLPSPKGLVREKTQGDHPCGPAKMYRRECFDDIGGIKPILGWDLADLLAAQMKGWETRCYFDLKITHYRPTGNNNSGFARGRFKLGRLMYCFGYEFYYVFFKGIYHLSQKPYLVGGLGLVMGFLWAALKREKMIFEPAMVTYLRKKHKSFFLKMIGIHQ